VEANSIKQELRRTLAVAIAKGVHRHYELSSGAAVAFPLR
jgi:hypothetical protein